MVSFNLPLLAFALAGLFARVNAYYEPISNGMMQEILDDDEGRTTTTIPITRHVTLTVTETAGAPAAATPTPTTLIPEIRPVPKTWYGAQKKHGCDRTACASCQYWNACRTGDETCAVECDSEPYCDCDAIDLSLDEGSHVDVVPAPPRYEMCRLGPGRTVSCDVITSAHAFHSGGKSSAERFDHPRNVRGKKHDCLHARKRV